MASLLFEEGTPNPPLPIYKKQLMNNVVDGLAFSKPEATYAEFPRSNTSYEEGFRKISWSEFANVVNGLAWWLKNTLGTAEGFPTLAYIGPFDIRYNTLLLGAVKAGYKMLFLSPRNSLPGQERLLDKTDCHLMITPRPHPPAVTEILSVRKLTVLEIPSVEELLSKKYEHFPYNKTFEAARKEPLVVLHTSGSTGFPKPIIWTHDYAASWQMWNQTMPPAGYYSSFSKINGVRLFSVFPPFHAGALFLSILFAIFNQTYIIFPLAGAIPSPQGVMDGLKHTQTDIAAFPPGFMDEISQNPDMLDFFAKNTTSIYFAGGSISDHTGDMISRKMRLWTFHGSTETGVWPSLFPAGEWVSEDWKYLNVNPASGIELQHYSEDLYEAVITRSEDPEKQPPCFAIFPDILEYRTQDLFSQHPTKPDLWQYRGRIDDIIVFLTGEKTNPISMEQHIMHHAPDVKGVIVIGTLRFQAALLIELAASEPLSTSEKAATIQRLWPTIQEANEEAPHFARIDKSHILFTDPHRPMDRAGKGTIQRKSTLVKYAKEIDALYADADKISAPTVGENLSRTAIDTSSSTSVSMFVRKVVTELTGFADLEDKDDFFVHGMDSLQTLQLTRTIKQTLLIPEFDITTVYVNSSVDRLTNAIILLSAQTMTSKLSFDKHRNHVLDRLLDGLKSLVDNIPPPKQLDESGGDIAMTGREVILTGSTGSIGSFILQKLLGSPHVSHIYCLNRERSSKVSHDSPRNVLTNGSSSRVTYITVDLSKPNLGLDPESYTKLQTRTTDIIHSAWPVNFNISIDSFQPSLSGIIHLLTLATSGVRHPSVFYISSVSSVSMYSSRRGDTIPEEEITDNAAAGPMGYAESKYLAERVMNYAAVKLPSLNISVARVGQVAGPVAAAGSWNRWEWFPSLVISSIHLGVIPESLGNNKRQVDWIPIDILADIIVELVLDTSASTGDKRGAKFFHLLNPQPEAWDCLLPVVIDSLNSNLVKRERTQMVSAVPYRDWLQKLRDVAVNIRSEELEATLNLVPAIKLLGFFESLLDEENLPLFDLKKTLDASTHLRELRGIRGEWMRKWINDWTAGVSGVLS